jgi:hypothetical protein
VTAPNPAAKWLPFTKTRPPELGDRVRVHFRRGFYHSHCTGRIVLMELDEHLQFWLTVDAWAGLYVLTSKRIPLQRCRVLRAPRRA